MSGRTGTLPASPCCVAVPRGGTAAMVAFPAGVAYRLGLGVLLGLVHAWQLLLRPVLGNNCRFEPGCSDYALAALRRHGAGRGSVLAVGRVLRCHPFCAGGHDPVPPAPTAPVRVGRHRKLP